eukprot:GHVH01014033.1.p1 GENE.GHVH01014033.1~~GHVH01014033.1.p1  ORF type:complete len:684 (+),score=98.55 GHVH01014033.1:55-2106(+)
MKPTARLESSVLDLVKYSFETVHPVASRQLLARTSCIERSLSKQGGAMNNEDDEKGGIKHPRRQKFSTDCCEILQLCHQCYSMGGIGSAHSVSKRMNAIIKEMAPLLLISEPWPLETWELLRLASDVVGFSVLLVRYLVEHTVKRRCCDDELRVCLTLLRNSPSSGVLPAPAVSEGQKYTRKSFSSSKSLYSAVDMTVNKAKQPAIIANREEVEQLFMNEQMSKLKPIVTMNDLHQALEKVLHNLISKTHESRSNGAIKSDFGEDLYFLFRLLIRLRGDDVLHPSFTERLPSEYLAILLEFLESKERQEGKSLNAYSVVRQQMEDTQIYKNALTNLFNYISENSESADTSYQYVLETCAQFLRQHPAVENRHEFVRRIAIDFCLEPKKDVIIYALEALTQFGVLTEDDIQIGIERSLERVGDLVLDGPALPFELSKFIFRALCENVVSLYAVENWVRLKVGGDCGLSVLRRVFLWLEKRPMYRRSNRPSLAQCIYLKEPFDSLRQRKSPSEVEIRHLKHEIQSLVVVLSREESSSFNYHLAVDEIEMNYNQNPNSAYYLGLILVCNFAEPSEQESCVVCYELLKIARLKDYLPQTILNYVIEEYVANGTLLIDHHVKRRTSVLERREKMIKLQGYLQKFLVKQSMKATTAVTDSSSQTDTTNLSSSPILTPPFLLKSSDMRFR